MKVTFEQVKRLANGEHVDKVIRKCDWDREDLVEALASRVVAVKRELEEYRGRIRNRLVTYAPATSEWSNAQCLEFLSVAFRHNDIDGDINFDDIRLGVRLAHVAVTKQEAE